MEVYTEMSKSTGLYHDDLQLLNNHIDFEPNNNRMKIYRLPYERITIETIKAFKNLGRKKRCEKLIFYVNDYEKDMLTNDNNFVQEGFIAGFFQGDDAYVFAMFLDPNRNQSIDKDEQHRVIDMVEQDKHIYLKRPLPAGYTMRHATVHDTSELAQLYDTIFETYPTPMNNAQYIENLMQDDVYFTIIEYHGQIVSASAADIIPDFNSAEMTDCATLLEHRQKGLLSHQFSYLIELMRQKGVQTLFCYSRAVSLGMNLINIRNGFTYGGRMVQNSNIAGRLECMNIWFKNISV